MTFQELALRILYALWDMAPGMLAALIVTVAAAALLCRWNRNTWLSSRRFQILSLFFGVPLRGQVRFACIWLKLVFICYFIAAFQAMGVIHYFMILFPGILGAFLDIGLRKWLENLFWLALQVLGMLSANMICRFLREMSGSSIFLLIYIAVGLFLALLSVYLFLSELLSLSAHRSVEAEAVWYPEETP